jgi:uncharacterized protein (UPF0332 family)
MTNWDALANDNKLAAFETFSKCRWRTCISRAYYAAYSAATEKLLLQGVTMPKTQPNPKHAKLPDLIGNNLVTLCHAVRWQLADAIARLYKLRLMADYMPRVLVEERDARIALGLMSQAFRCMRGKE